MTDPMHDDRSAHDHNVDDHNVHRHRAHGPSAHGRADDDHTEGGETERDAPTRGPAARPGPWVGATCSSLQVEGVAPAADWSRWERAKRVPPSNDGNGFGLDHADDFTALADLGLTHVRLTLEWARMEPERGRPDAEALDRYDDILTSARRAGLSVIATLQHGTLPGWYSEDSPGHRDRKERRAWLRHVDRCAERFDDRVSTWVPIDDPIGWAVRGYLLGSRPPGRRDPVAAMEAVEGALFANHEAWDVLRSGDTPVMAVFNAPTIFAVGPDAEPARQRTQELLIDPWIAAVRDGELRIPGRPLRRRDDLAGSFDMLGVTHDHPIGVDREGSIVPYPEGGRRAANGFTPLVDELGELLGRLHEELPERRLVIAGHGVLTNDDEWRGRILVDTMHLLAGALDDGIALEGYLHDTGIDGYEGPYGFTSAKGLLDRGRNVKESGASLRHHLRRHEPDPRPVE